MNTRHAANAQRMIDAVLTSPGDTDPALRRAVEARAAEPGGHSTATAGEVPDTYRNYCYTNNHEQAKHGEALDVCQHTANR